MKFEEQFAKPIAILKAQLQTKEDELSAEAKEEAKTQKKQAVAEITGSFWGWLCEGLGEIIRENGDATKFLDENAAVIDLGLQKELVNVEEMKAAIMDADISDCCINVRTMSQWLKVELRRARGGDDFEKLSQKNKLELDELDKLTKEIAEQQAFRRSKIEPMYMKPDDCAKQIAQLEATEKLLLDSVRKNKEISKGAFLSVEQKRENMKQKQDLHVKLESANKFVAGLPNQEGAVEMKKLTKRIHEELFIKLVDMETVAKKTGEELEALQKKADAMPASEVETKVSDAINNIRDMVRLSAKRLGIEPFPLFTPNDKKLPMSELRKNLDRITEFDPRLFKNDRIAVVGRPFVLVVPATGNAIFDYQTNSVIMPTIAPAGNYMASLSKGMVEYRLDADEEKVLLTSYNGASPDLKKLRSLFDLKASLTKDYITWMTKEYNGTRIMPKENLKWFQQEIGPNKNEIFVPLKYQGYTMTSAEFNKLFDEVSERIKEAEEKETDPTPEDLWVGSLLFYDMGKPEKALPLIEKYVKVKPDHLMAWYNLGHISMKQMNKAQAREAFDRFCKMDTSSWWSKAVRDVLRNLGPAS
ncbi:MAG: tetratricopeptide repeat protein [Chitinispirillia bacterium]|nr:tetratricopeptide repeat protein [Chitinispirillia bacterium]